MAFTGIYGRATEGGTFGTGNGVIWLTDVECVGTEVRLDECSHREWGQHSCRHIEDAGVECSDQPG